MAELVRVGQMWAARYTRCAAQTVRVTQVAPTCVTSVVITPSSTGSLVAHQVIDAQPRSFTKKYKLLFDPPTGDQPDMTWTDQSECRGKAELFDLDSTPDPEQALRLCAGCPVLVDCAKAAVRDGNYGVIQAGKLLFRPAQTIHSPGVRARSSVGYKLVEAALTGGEMAFRRQVRDSVRRATAWELAAANRLAGAE